MLRITMAQAGRKAIGTGATERCLPIQFFALAEEAFRDEPPPQQVCAICDCLDTNQGFEAGEKDFQLKNMNFWNMV